MHILRNAIDYVGRIEFNVARTFFVGVILGCLTVNPAAADPGEGTLFGLSGNTGQLLSIDPVTGVATAIGPGLGFSSPALAREPGTGTLYAGRGAGNPNIYTVDATTGVATLVANSGLGFAAIGSLDFRADGVLFAAVNIAGDGGTGADHLATIDPGSGFATLVGPFGTCTGVPSLPVDGTGSCTIEGIEGIAFDSDGLLWGVHSERGAAGLSGLYSINPLTGAATFVGQLVDDVMGNTASGGFVSLQFGCDGTTYLGSARAFPPSGSDGGTLATIGPGDLASLTFAFAGTPSTAGSSLSALAFESECTVVVGDDVVVLPPDPEVPVTASVQEVIKPGTIEVTSGCVLDRGRPHTVLNLMDAINASTTSGCMNLATELAKLGSPAAVLRKQHRGFPPVDMPDDMEIFEVALVVSRNTEGDTDQLTKGVVVQEAEPKEAGVLDPDCDTSGSDVSQSPFTAGINLSGKESSGAKGRNVTGACNRARDFSHFSNQLLAYPLRVDPSELPLKAQVLQEAADARSTIRLNQEFGCVDGPFLRNLKRQLNRAMRDVNKGKILKGMCAMQEATLFALAPAPADDPYGSCPNGDPLGPDDPAGEIPSRFLALAYQIHRLLLHPDGFTPYENDPRVLCELSTLPGDPALICPPPGPGPGLSAACAGL